MAETKKAENTEEARKVDPAEFQIDAKELTEAFGQTMENLIKMAVPVSIAEQVQKMIDEHETNYIEHEDEIAVLNISTASLQKNDCIPGYIDVPCTPTRFTKGGLRVKDRYPVKINFVPSGQEIYNWAIITRGEWDEAQKSREGEMLTNEQMVAAQMLRTGGAI